MGPDKGCVCHTLRYLAELVKVEDGGNFSADPERGDLPRMGSQIPWVLHWALKYGSIFQFKPWLLLS